MISHAHLSFRTQPRLGEKSLFASIFPLLTFERSNLPAFNLPFPTYRAFSAPEFRYSLDCFFKVLSVSTPPTERTKKQSREYLNSGAEKARRSEEHTSELQSLRHLVCR